MDGVANAARTMGTEKAEDVPFAVIGKLPMQFKAHAFGVHGSFDVVAADTETIGMPKHTLGQLSEILQKCVACHSGNRLEATTNE